MHIVITRRAALDYPGGINIFIFSLAYQFIRNGHQVTVVGSSIDDDANIPRFAE
jgi:hypothetical protein